MLLPSRFQSDAAQPHALGELIAAQADFDAALSTVEEVLVFASYLDKHGPTYNVMGRAELKE